MTSQDDSDLDDPIQLTGFDDNCKIIIEDEKSIDLTSSADEEENPATKANKNSNDLKKTATVDSTDQRKNIHKRPTEDSSKLPVTFFLIPRNVKLLNRCRSFTLKVVDVDKHPSYYRNVKRDKDAILINSNSCVKETNMHEKKPGSQIKIRPIDTPYEKLKVGDKIHSPQSVNDSHKWDIAKQIMIQTKAEAEAKSQIDYKKNVGLIGLKITQTFDIQTTPKKDKKRNKKEEKERRKKLKKKEKKAARKLIVSNQLISKDDSNKIIGDVNGNHKSSSSDKIGFKIIPEKETERSVFFKSLPELVGTKVIHAPLQVKQNGFQIDSKENKKEEDPINKVKRVNDENELGKTEESDKNNKDEKHVQKWVEKRKLMNLWKSKTISNKLQLNKPVQSSPTTPKQINNPKSKKTVLKKKSEANSFVNPQNVTLMKNKSLVLSDTNNERDGSDRTKVVNANTLTFQVKPGVLQVEAENKLTVRQLGSFYVEKPNDGSIQSPLKHNKASTPDYIRQLSNYLKNKVKVQQGNQSTNQPSLPVTVNSTCQKEANVPIPLQTHIQVNGSVAKITMPIPNLHNQTQNNKQSILPISSQAKANLSPAKNSNPNQSPLMITNQKHHAHSTQLHITSPQVTAITPSKIQVNGKIAKITMPIPNDRTPNNLMHQNSKQTSQQSELKQAQVSGNSMPTQIDGNPVPAQIGGNPMLTQVVQNRLPDQVGGSAMPAQVGRNPIPAQLGGNAMPAQVDRNRMPDQVGGSAMTAQAGGNLMPAQVDGNALAVQVGRNDMLAQVGGNAMSARLGGNAMPVQVGGNPMPAQISGNPMPTQVVRNRMPDQVGGTAMPAQVSRNPIPAQVGGNAMPAQVGGNAMPAQVDRNRMADQVSRSAMPAQAGGNPMPAQVGENALAAQVGGYDMLAQVSGNAMSARVGGNAIPVQVGGNPTPAQVSGNAMPAQVCENTRPAQVEAMPVTNINPNPNNQPPSWIYHHMTLPPASHMAQQKQNIQMFQMYADYQVNGNVAREMPKNSATSQMVQKKQNMHMYTLARQQNTYHGFVDSPNFNNPFAQYQLNELPGFNYPTDSIQMTQPLFGQNQQYPHVENVIKSKEIAKPGIPNMLPVTPNVSMPYLTSVAPVNQPTKSSSLNQMQPSPIETVIRTRLNEQRRLSFNGLATPPNEQPPNGGFPQQLPNPNFGRPMVNYMHCAPIYNEQPQNVTGLYWSIMHPPPQPPPPSPYPALRKQLNQTNSSAAPASSSKDATIIGENKSGPIRKISLIAVPITEFEKSPQYQNKETSKNPAQLHNVTPPIDSLKGVTPVNSKTEMLEELTKAIGIYSPPPSPVGKDLKRPSETEVAQEAIPQKVTKTGKPGPLSKKPKLEFSSTSSTNRPKTPVIQSGYSPPILPIPSFQQSIEMLKIKDQRRNINNINVALKAVGKFRRAQDEKSKMNVSANETKQKSVKKISINDYKKRVEKPDEKKEGNSVEDNIKIKGKCKRSVQP